jgi:hypothetical protein
MMIPAEYITRKKKKRNYESQKVFTEEVLPGDS